MKKIIFVWFVIVFACIGFTGCEEDPVKIPPPEISNEFQTNNNLDNTWLRVQANANGIVSRDICEFLVEAAGNNWPQDRLRTTLRNIAALQIRDNRSPYYGNFLWTKGDNVPMSTTSSFDINGVLFCGTYLTLLQMKYYDKLNTDNKSMLDEIMQLILISVDRDIDSRRATYTNTWAMRTWILCGLGEALSDATVLNLGKESLREWMQNIHDYGIVEYNSGVYASVTARSLGLMANLAQDSEIKREAGIILRYFSRLMAGNFVSYDDRGMVYGGPQSRNSNYVHSKGGSDIFYLMFTGGQQGFVNKHAAWSLSAEDRALYQQKNRTILYKNGVTGAHFAIHYVGSKFSMGSAGSPHGNDDKTHVINFFDAARPAVVHVSSYIIGHTDVYGQVGVRNRLHSYLLARAQRVITSGSEMIFLIAADGAERGDTQSLNHYIVLPADRQDGLWNGNTRISDLAQNASQVLSSTDHSTLFIRFGDVATGIRYLKALDVHDADVLSAVKLVNTPNAPQNISAGTAMYLQAQLSTAKPPEGSCGVVALWWKVKEGITTDAQFTDFRNEMINAPVTFLPSDNEYTVKVTTPDGELGVSGNKVTKLQTANYGGLTMPSGGNFIVNGTDIAPSFFAGSTNIN